MGNASVLSSTFQHPIYKSLVSVPKVSYRTLATIKEFKLNPKEGRVLSQGKDHSEANKAIAQNYR